MADVVPVLAQDTSEEPLDDTGDFSDVPVLAHDDGMIGDIADDDPLMRASTDADDNAVVESRTGWRVERFGPKAPDGKGRYWQWRTGRAKNRRASYGGKVENQAGEYWQRHSKERASTGTTDIG